MDIIRITTSNSYVKEYIIVERKYCNEVFTFQISEYHFSVYDGYPSWSRLNGGKIQTLSPDEFVKFTKRFAEQDSIEGAKAREVIQNVVELPF